ncbi:BTAD domain-containing putative transcriptional regulator [Nocardia sp. NPDC004722]
MLSIESAGVVTFQVLGPLRAEDERGPLALKGPRHRALLARLLLAHGRVVPLTQLIDDLWERPPRDPHGAIQTFVSDLRRSLEPDRKPREPARVLVTVAPGYALRVTPGQVDADRFESLIRAAADLVGGNLEPGGSDLIVPSGLAPGRADARSRADCTRRSDLTGALSDLDAALRLWQGPAYAEFADQHWARAEIDRLLELRSLAIEQRALALTGLSRHAEAVVALESHLREHPLRESAWHTLALALYRSGRQADALTALRTIRTALRTELGVDPGPRLRQLESDILTQAPGLTPRILRADARAETPTASESSPPTSDGDFAVAEAARTGTDDVGTVANRRVLLGRAAELARLRAVAEEVNERGQARAVLISGVEGVGKTALVEAFSAGLRDQGWTVAWGSDPADGGAPPYWPWTQI